MIIGLCTCLSITLTTSLFCAFHLIQWWDIGKGFKIPEVYRTGYTVIGLSIATSIALACL